MGSSGALHARDEPPGPGKPHRSPTEGLSTGLGGVRVFWPLLIKELNENKPRELLMLLRLGS